jgi:hypothetical protein
VNDIETIREALKTADWRELRVVESQEAHEALDTLDARLKHAERLVEAARRAERQLANAACQDVTRPALHELRTALNQASSEEEPPRDVIEARLKVAEGALRRIAAAKPGLIRAVPFDVRQTALDALAHQPSQEPK